MTTLTVAQARAAFSSASDKQIEKACKARGYTIGSAAQNRSKLQFALDKLKPESDSLIDEKDFPPIVVIKTKKRSAPKPQPSPRVSSKAKMRPLGTSAKRRKIVIEAQDDDEEIDVPEIVEDIVDKAKKIDQAAKPWLGYIELIIEVTALIVLGVLVGNTGSILSILAFILVLLQTIVSIRRG